MHTPGGQGEHASSLKLLCASARPEQWLAKASDIRAITTKRSFPRRAIIKDISPLRSSPQDRNVNHRYTKRRGGELAFKSSAKSWQLESGNRWILTRFSLSLSLFSLSRCLFNLRTRRPWMASDNRIVESSRNSSDSAVFRYSFAALITLAEVGASKGDQEGFQLFHCVYQQPTLELNLIFENLSLTHSLGRERHVNFRWKDRARDTSFFEAREICVWSKGRSWNCSTTIIIFVEVYTNTESNWKPEITKLQVLSRHCDRIFKQIAIDERDSRECVG